MDQQSHEAEQSERHKQCFALVRANPRQHIADVQAAALLKIQYGIASPDAWQLAHDEQVDQLITRLGNRGSRNPALRERQIANLVRSLRDFGDQDLARKLNDCQIRRLRHLDDVAGGADVRWPQRCRSVACASCRTSLARRWQQRVEMRFEDDDNSDCSMVTILLARCASLDQVTEVIAQTRKALRNLCSRRGWSILVDGAFEIDGIYSSDLPNLLPKRREAIADLPVNGHQTDWLWIPTLHIVVSHQGVQRSDLLTSMNRLWPGRGQVDVKETYSCFLPSANAGTIVSYGLKHRCETKIGWETIPWPIEMAASYWSWLCSKRRGVEPLRLRLRPTRRKKQSSIPYRTDMLSGPNDGSISPTLCARAAQAPKSIDDCARPPAADLTLSRQASSDDGWDAKLLPPSSMQADPLFNDDAQVLSQSKPAPRQTFHASG